MTNNCEDCNEGLGNLEVYVYQYVWKIVQCGCPRRGVVYYFMSLLNSDMSYL